MVPGSVWNAGGHIIFAPKKKTKAEVSIKRIFETVSDEISFTTFI